MADPIVDYTLHMKKKFYFKLRRNYEKIPMNAASMSRHTIGAYLGLYLKSLLKAEVKNQRDKGRTFNYYLIFQHIFMTNI